MNEIKKSHGFTNEKMFIIPRDLLSNTTSHPLLTNLYLTDVGYFPNAKFHYRERLEGSDQYILILNIKGEGFIKVNENKYKVEENTLLLIPKGLGHIYGSEAKIPWNIYWIHFNGENAPLYFKDFIKENLYIKPISISLLPKITSLFKSIFDTLENGMTINNMIHSSQILAYILSSLFIYKDIYNENLDKKTEIFIQVFEYMHKNISNEITLDDLAKVINLSKSQLTLIFKDKTGFPPIDYFIRIKIQEASKLLNLTSLSINEIARKVGYDDPYYFSRIFKRVMGVSPNHYRKKQVI